MWVNDGANQAKSWKINFLSLDHWIHGRLCILGSPRLRLPFGLALSQIGRQLGKKKDFEKIVLQRKLFAKISDEAHFRNCGGYLLSQDLIAPSIWDAHLPAATYQESEQVTLRKIFPKRTFCQNISGKNTSEMEGKVSKKKFLPR